MPTVTRELGSLDETRLFADEFARTLRGGDVVLLRGELGAGKTTLTRLVARAIGVRDGEVSSPTFVIAVEHAVPAGGGADASVRRLVHADAYRLGNDDDLDAIGWDRLLGEDAAVFIEWPDRLPPGALPAAAAERAICVLLEHAGETSRSVRVDRPGLSGSSAQGGAAPTRCPVTGQPVPADSPTWPFSSERARMADLHRWMSGEYTLSRPLEPEDMDEHEDRRWGGERS